MPADRGGASLLYEGITDSTWPSWLKIHVSQIDDSGRVIEEASDLTEQLQLQYYLPWYQVEADAGWRKTGFISKYHRYPEFNFLIKLPEAFAGRQLRFQVVLDHPRWGRLEAAETLIVVAPCSDTDRLRILDSYIYLYTTAREYEQALALADSFIASGWRSKWGLEEALQAATFAKRYDDALRLLDLCFEANGSVSRFKQRDAASERAFYVEKRVKLEKLRDQQQQR